MNELEKERHYTFWPKLDWRLGGDRKTTGETQRYTKILTNKYFSRVKNFSPKMTGEGANIVSFARYQHIVNDYLSKKGHIFRKSISFWATLKSIVLFQSRFLLGIHC